MGKNKNIVIVGHFGGDENVLDGQTIKTKILYEELLRATDWKIIKVDTYYKKKNPIKLMLFTIWALLFAKDVVVLLSGNGMKFYFPLLYISSKLLCTKVYHDVIGGNLDSYVEKIPQFKKYLNSFEINWVETEGLKHRLSEKGIDNCEVIPNFKRLNSIREEEVKASNGEEYRFCMFSRVMKEKGIEEAIKTVQLINKERGKVVCTLDIYGVIDDGYKVSFEKIMSKVSPAIQYRGKVSYEKSVETIKGYYALLFPTFWHGEGFPGTIIDAFSAGLPVIATDWSCNGEIVENGKNGILYPNNVIKDLKGAIEYLISIPDGAMEMRKYCVKSAEKYLPDKYIEKIVNRIKD